MADIPVMEQSKRDVSSVLEKERHGRLRLLAQVGIAIAFVILCMWVTELLNGSRMAEGIPAITIVFGEMVPPDFTRWRAWVSPLIDTVAMSVAGTALAIALSLPLGFLAAPNTTPNRFVYQVARLVLNTLRAIPELILGIVFVAAVGFGMLPGVLALPSTVTTLTALVITS